MTTKNYNNQILYQCDDCKMWYKTKELAKSCEDHCKNKGACSMEITKQAVML